MLESVQKRAATRLSNATASKMVLGPKRSRSARFFSHRRVATVFKHPLRSVGLRRGQTAIIPGRRIELQYRDGILSKCPKKTKNRRQRLERRLVLRDEKFRQFCLRRS